MNKVYVLSEEPSIGGAIVAIFMSEKDAEETRNRFINPGMYFIQKHNVIETKEQAA